MGYTTVFDGRIEITPPLNPHEIAYLRHFAASRRMDRTRGPYYVGTGPFLGDQADVLDHNRPPDGQPGLNCKWEPTDDGTALEWNGVEKFYDSEEWMAYLIKVFLDSGSPLRAEFADPLPGRVYPPELAHFSFDHLANGQILAQGEDVHDRWYLIVRNNQVSTATELPPRRAAPTCPRDGGTPAVEVSWETIESFSKTFTVEELLEVFGDDEALTEMSGDGPIDWASYLGEADIDEMLGDLEGDEAGCFIACESRDITQIRPLQAAPAA